MKNVLPLIFVSFCLQLQPVIAQQIDFSTLEKDSVTDIDGNIYQTIRFGNTWWMSSNLRTKHYNDGSPVTQMTKFINDTDPQNNWDWWTGAERWGYTNLDSLTFDTYGLLYSWYAAMNTKNGGICPQGWALTDTGNWNDLARLVVGESNLIYEYGLRPTPSGGTEGYFEVIQINGLARYLKSDNGILWNLTPTISRTCNQADMNIVPTGKLNTRIEGFGELADFWTTNYVHADKSGQGRRYYNFTNVDHNIYPSRNHNANLQCVRCVKAAHNLSVSPNSVTLSSKRESIDSIYVTANYIWNISYQSDWLSVSQTGNSGNGKIYIKSLSENPSRSARTDTIKINSDGAKTLQVIVTQAGGDPLFSVSNTSLVINGENNSSTSFSVSSTESWTINTSACWLITDKTSGTGNAPVIITSERNSTSDIRSAFIQVNCPNLDSTITINIKQDVASPTRVGEIGFNGFNIYPNPASGFLFVSGLTGKYQIVSIDGRLIKAGTLKATINKIDLTGISNGMYFFKTENVIKKIVLQ